MGLKRKGEGIDEMPEPADQSAERETPFSNSPRGSTKKTKQDSCAASGHSSRLQSTIMNVLRQEIEPAFKEVLESWRENMDEQAKEVHELRNSASAKKSLEEKLDHLIELVGALGRTLENFFSKASSSEKESNADSPRMGHKSLYTDFQKKIEELKKENRELSLKLETAASKLERTEALEKERNEISQELKQKLALLEGYEKGMRVSADLLQTFKDLTVATTLAKATELVKDSNAQPPKTDAKRK